MRAPDPAGRRLGRTATVLVAAFVALATWASMVVVLDYVALQHALSLNAERVIEVAPGFIVAGLVAAAVCWLTSAATRRPLRTVPLVLGLVVMDGLAATGALVAFGEIPPDRFPLVLFAATGGGLQLLGSVVGARLGAGAGR